MRRDTYLNIVLTLIAVLLTADLWVRIADRPFVAETAVAQSRSQANRLGPRKNPPQKGVSAIGTEAIDQRAEMISALNGIREQFNGLRGLLESGGIKVQLSEPSEDARDRVRFPCEALMSSTSTSRPRAYTLIELIMVVALLGIAAAILGPQLINLGRLEASSAVRRLVADITFAQSEALAAQSFTRIHFYDDGRGYCLLNVTESDFDQPFDSDTADYVPDPSGLVRGLGHYIVDYSRDDRFESVTVSELALDDGGRSLTFDSLGGTVESPGTPAGEGRIVLTGEEAEYEVTVAPVTGKVSVLRIDG